MLAASYSKQGQLQTLETSIKESFFRVCAETQKYLGNLTPLNSIARCVCRMRMGKDLQGTPHNFPGSFQMKGIGLSPCFLNKITLTALFSKAFENAVQDFIMQS